MTTPQDTTRSVSLLQDLVINKRVQKPKIAITSKSFSVLSILKKVVLEQLVAVYKPQHCIWLDSEHPPSDVFKWLHNTCSALTQSTVVIDLFTDLLGVMPKANTANSSVIQSTLDDLQENLKRVAKQTCAMVIIENYNILVKRKGWHFLRECMDILLETNETMAYVLLGCHEDDNHVHKLAHLVLSGNQWKLVDNMIQCSIVSIRHLPSGNIRQEEFQLTASNVVPNSKEIPSKTYLKKIDSTNIATPHETEDLSEMFGDLPFKIALSGVERDRRAQVELPYVHKNVSVADTALEEHPKGLLVPSSDEDPEQDSDEDLDV
ncbi:hypothetical protein GpartN1_g717.t1 [Galdieria partita]|uniref:Elongator complex protein 5 n=1 Tax=Galdieria partita TaxID=83374 RepID=A0A9C7PSA3_9RHOD|nr:hypothetical protein GpartN1_g717.t1 [Galdieria partita]